LKKDSREKPGGWGMLKGEGKKDDLKKKADSQWMQKKLAQQRKCSRPQGKAGQDSPS